jgi:hypothetical protein
MGNLKKVEKYVEKKTELAKLFFLKFVFLNSNLTSDGQLMTQLCFSGSELAEKLGDRACLNAALQQLVQFLRARGQLNDLGTLHVKLSGGSESHRYELVRLHLGFDILSF